MATEVNLPALGESVTEGTITRWLKQVGDQVAVDEPLLEVSTDKVDTEIPSPVAGTLLEIKAEEDETVEVGAVLAVIGDEGESADDASDSAEPEAQPADAEASEQKAEQEEEHAEETGELPDGDETPESEKDDAPPQEEPAAEEAASGSSGGSGGGGGTSTSVTLPALGESVTEGTVTRWLKQVGDEVAVDEPLLEVSTDKVDTEIPSPAAGTLLEIKVQEDETVEVGAELALIGEAGSGGGSSDEGDSSDADSSGTDSSDADSSDAGDTAAEADAGDEQAEEQQAQEQAVEPESDVAPADETEEGSDSEAQTAPDQATADAGETPAPPAEVKGDGDGGRDPSAYVTPLVRKMAAQHGVDLSTVKGTGVGGRIRKQDVLDAAGQQGTTAPAPTGGQTAAATAAAQQPAAASASAQAPAAPTPSPLRGKTEPMSRLRKVIAQRMVESLQTSAQLTTVVEVDVTAISRLRDSVKADFAAREGVKLSFMPFFAKAAIDALKAHPSLNAAIDTEKGEVTYYDRENLAIAVDTERGLLSPVIKDAGDLSVAGLARKIADIAERTRTNKITPDELGGGTFTLTNTGSRGALFDTPIINQPQVAILGTGAVVKRAVVIDDPNLGETIAVRQMVYLALTYDHRLVDGADAARFLSDVKARLEAGQFEV